MTVVEWVLLRGRERKRQGTLTAGDASGDSVQWVRDTGSRRRQTVRTCSRWLWGRVWGHRGFWWCSARAHSIVRVKHSACGCQKRCAHLKQEAMVPHIFQGPCAAPLRHQHIGIGWAVGQRLMRRANWCRLECVQSSLARVGALLISSPLLNVSCCFSRAGGASPSIDQMLSVASDQLAEQLDAQKGSSVSDSAIFRAHAAKYEVRGVAPSTGTRGGSSLASRHSRALTLCCAH